MKKLFLLILVPFCFIIGGQDWKWLNPLPQGRNINQLCAFDTLIAYAVTDNSVFIKTTDGGNNWQITTTEYSNQILYSLYFKDINTGWVTGENGLILFTNDGGQSFTKQASNTNQNLHSIYSNGSKLFAAGSNGTLLISSNNGLSWTKKELQISEGFTSVYFINSLKGFITGSNGIILRTTDSGDTWNSSTSLINGIISSITFTDENNGWACGQNGTILRTVNSGASWNLIPSPSNKWFTSVSFMNNSTGLITGKEGVYLRTSDGGNNWNLFKQDSTFSFTTSSLITNGGGWIAGSSGFIAKTIDAGLTWDFQSSGDRAKFNTVKFINPDTGFVVGDNGLFLRTTDGGDNWTELNLNTNYNLYDVCYYYWNNKKIIFLAADSSTVFKSTDFGDNWTTIDMRKLINVSLRTVAACPYGLIVAGLSGVIGTINFQRGDALAMTKTTMTAPMTSIVFYSGNHAYVSGEGGSLYMMNFSNQLSANGGPPYSPVSTSLTFSDLNQIYFMRGLGFIVGKYGVLLKTVGFRGFALGYDWSKSIINISNPKGIAFLDSSNGYICGNGGVLLRTTDSGKNWTNIQTNLSTSLLRMQWINPEKGFLVGPNGLLIRTDNGGGFIESNISNIKESVPVAYSLEQNYPNPFNPSTSISYTIPQENFVSLRVYDLLGKEVCTLINEFQKQGTHTAEFNGSSLSSGIYFYVLKINERTESRKMILLK